MCVFKDYNKRKIWAKLQRKIKALSNRITVAGYNRKKRRLLKRLIRLVQKLFDLNKKWRLGIEAGIIGVWLASSNIYAQPVFDVSNLDGSNGFKVVNGPANGLLGHDLSGAGDFNGDGFQDLLVSASDMAGSPNNSTGRIYVIFGTSGPYPASLDVADLDGTNGIALVDSVKLNRTGVSVSSIGDFNGDGFDDLLIGESRHDYTSGTVYVLFGSKENGPEISLNNLDGTNGFQIKGDSRSYYFGKSVSGIGDINDDGFDDIAFSGAVQLEKGEVYLVYGSDSISVPEYHIDSLINANEVTVLKSKFKIYSSYFGGDVFNDAISHGDLNGDGFEDVVIGHAGADRNGEEQAGAVYVLFGSDQKLPVLIDVDSLDGQNGFSLDGYEYYGLLGHTVAVGDINGDGFDDIFASNYDYTSARSTLLFGKSTGFDAGINAADLNGSDGFDMIGFNMDDDNRYGYLEASLIDDVNGDGFDDMIIGADNKTVNTIDDAGQVFVVFGNEASAWPAHFDVSTLDENSGFVINGTSSGEKLGSSVAGIGDINGDGGGDFAVAGSKGEEAFVIFGKGDPTPIVSTPNQKNSESVKIFPKLSNGHDIIRFSKPLNNPRLYSLKGAKITSYSTRRDCINIDHIASGTYFLVSENRKFKILIP